MRLIFWTILLFGMWLILSSNLHMPNLLIGLGVSFFIALLYINMFKSKQFELINPYWLIVYILVMTKNLIISNLQITKKVLSKDMKLNPAIVAIKTELKSDWKKLLLANSITLTPGTLTLDIKDNILYIHTIECMDDKEEISKEFENIINKL